MCFHLSRLTLYNTYVIMQCKVGGGFHFNPFDGVSFPRSSMSQKEMRGKDFNAETPEFMAC